MPDPLTRHRVHGLDFELNVRTVTAIRTLSSWVIVSNTKQLGGFPLFTLNTLDQKSHGYTQPPNMAAKAMAINIAIIPITAIAINSSAILSVIILFLCVCGGCSTVALPKPSSGTGDQRRASILLQTIVGYHHPPPAFLRPWLSPRFISAFRCFLSTLL